MRKGVLALLLIVLAANLKAQDPEFSQFYMAPLYLNPAFTGTTVRPKVHLNFRDQWPGLGNAYVSMACSYDQYFEDLRSGIGIQLVGDRAGGGIYSTYTVVGLYSYQANLTDGFALKFGLHGGFGQKRLDMTKVFFYDQINPVTGFTDPGNNINPTGESVMNSSLVHAELGAGVLAYSEVFYAGISARHINTPIETFRNDYSARLPVRYSGHLGAAIPLGGRRSDVTLSPNLLYTQQAAFRQLNTGMSLKVGYVFGGAWMRYDFNNIDALILLIGTQIGILTAGYSYDLTLSGLMGHSGGAHELGITFNFDQLPGGKSSSPRFLKCPAFY